MRMMVPLILGGCSIENSLLPGHNTDTFGQEASPNVDILFVVDNSASMKEEQAALAAGFQAFIDEIENASADWHIGIITTS